MEVLNFHVLWGLVKSLTCAHRSVVLIYRVSGCCSQRNVQALGWGDLTMFNPERTTAHKKQTLPTQHSAASLEPPCLGRLAGWESGLHKGSFYTTAVSLRYFKLHITCLSFQAPILGCCLSCCRLVTRFFTWCLFLLSEDSALCISVEGKKKTHSQSKKKKNILSCLLLKPFFLFSPAEAMFPDQSDLDYGESAAVNHSTMVIHHKAQS